MLLFKCRLMRSLHYAIVVFVLKKKHGAMEWMNRAHAVFGEFFTTSHNLKAAINSIKWKLTFVIFIDHNKFVTC